MAALPQITTYSSVRSNKTPHAGGVHSLLQSLHVPEFSVPIPPVLLLSSDNYVVQVTLICLIASIEACLAPSKTQNLAVKLSRQSLRLRSLNGPISGPPLS